MINVLLNYRGCKRGRRDGGRHIGLAGQARTRLRLRLHRIDGWTGMQESVETVDPEGDVMSDQTPDEQTESDEQSTSTGAEEYGSLTVEDNPDGTVFPADLAGTADEVQSED
jgi:hypothetical protein